MVRSIYVMRAFGLLIALFLLCIASPLFSHAESTSDLSATIRAEIMSDPRTSGLTDAQIDSLVVLLTEEAQKRGITSQDIQWRPQNAERFVPGENAGPSAPECMGGFLCTLSEAFGFIGPDATIPFMLGAASMGLIWVIAEMIHRRRHPYVLPTAAAAAAPPPASQV